MRVSRHLSRTGRRWDNTDAIPTEKLANATAATTAEIDARIADWAETGNTNPIPEGKLVNAPVSTTAVDARIADWAETGNTEAIPADKLTNAPSAGGAGSHVLGTGQGILNVFSLAVSDRQVVLDDDTLYRLAITYGTGTAQRRFSVWFTGSDLFTLDSPVGDLTGPGINRVPVADRFAEDFGGRTWQFAKSPEGNLAWAWPDAPNRGGVFGDNTATTILEELSVSGSAGLNSRQVDERIKAGVYNWAEEGNTDLIPTNKVGDALDNRIVEWAREGSTDAIPANRLTNAPATAVVTDDTLDGTGVAGDALMVANAIPDGGTAGQVLSRTATGYEWGAGGGGGGGSGSGSRLLLSPFALFDTLEYVQRLRRHHNILGN